MDLFTSLFDSKYIGMDDLHYLRKLLDTDLSLNYCLQLLENSRNKTAFKDIRDQLSKGKLIEEFIGDYLPKPIKEYMVPLLHNLSLSESLALSLDFYGRNNNSILALVSDVAYPLIMLFVTISALYLFDLYGIDSIFSLLDTIGLEIGLYNDVRIVFRIVIHFFYYGILIGIALFAYFLNSKRICYLYLFVSKYFPSSLMNIYYSEEFVSLLLICVKRGFGYKKSLEILKRMKNKPVISMLAFHLDESLLDGEQLNEAVKKKYYDASLSRFIRIASSTDDFSGVLDSYTNLARERINRRVKASSRIIQITTYLIIGIIVIFIYQVLFMPMQAISAY